MFTTVFDKYTSLASVRTNKKSKQKQQETNAVTDRDRLATVTKIVSALRSKLQNCDEALGNYYTICLLHYEQYFPPTQSPGRNPFARTTSPIVSPRCRSIPTLKESFRRPSRRVTTWPSRNCVPSSKINCVNCGRLAIDAGRRCCAAAGHRRTTNTDGGRCN